MAQTSDSLTTTGSVTLTKPAPDTLTVVQISGTYGTCTFVFEGSIDGTNFFALAAHRYDTGALVSGTIAPSDDAEQAWAVPSVGLVKIRARVTALSTGTATFTLHSGAFVGLPPTLSLSSGTFGATTFAGDVSVDAGAELLIKDVGTVAAAGSAQGDAASLATYQTTYVSAADGTKGVVLPAAVAGTLRLVYNTHATSGLKVYPASGDDINDGSADAAVTIEGKSLALFLALDAATWGAIFVVNT